MKRAVYKAFGLLAVGLGVLGAFLPVLPTTPFLLLALWLFNRSSPKLREWLLNNALCGEYLSDYYSGRGVPRRVKVYVLIFMWAFMIFSTLYLVDILWVRIMLLVVSVGVTIHVLRIKTKNMYRKITIIVPTEAEGAILKKQLPGGVTMIEGGVGMAEIAAAVVRAMQNSPDLLILAGVAGAYVASKIEVGSCVVVGSERITDLGAFRDKKFQPLYTKEYRSQLADSIESLPRAIGSTVNAGGAPFADISGELANAQKTENCFCGAQVESMEGAVFFALCGELKVEFLEIRAISNLTTDSRSQWRLEEATEALADGVTRVIEELRSRR